MMYNTNMRLISVIPITKIPLPLPQTLSYFSSAKNLKIGSLVSVPVGKRKAPGIVIGQKNIEDEKINIKKADFQLRPIDKVLNPNPVISKNQLALALWMHEYYYEPLGLVLKTILPTSQPKTYNLKPISYKKHPSSPRLRRTDKNTNLLQSNLEDGIDYFKKEIEKTIKNKRQILILVPDINTLNNLQKNIRIDLSNQYKSVSITSKTPQKLFQKSWQEISQNKIQITLGTRKSLFVPFQNLGLIILAEEHSSNYKSWRQHPKYHTREVAIKLAELHNAKLIMQSTTPNVETKSQITNYKSQTNFKSQISNPEHAINHKIIDMKKELKSGNYSIFSNVLLDEIKKTIKKNGKIALFINRRGESTVVMCRDCSHIIKCKNCEVPMVFHQTYNLQPKTYNLICHHCSYKEKAPDLCPKCSGHRIKFFGTGTQKVERELQKILPNTHILRLDSDTAKNDKDKKEIIEKFTSKNTILIGTQLINTVELPKLDLIGIINIETMLNMPDFHSSEKTFQIITSLLNKLRNRGKIMLQTYSPDNYAIKYGLKNDYTKFYEEEIKIRKLFSYPPFSQIIKLSFAHRNKLMASQEAKRLHTKLITYNLELAALGEPRPWRETYNIIGPAPAFISRKGGQYVWNIIVKTENKPEIRNQLLKLIPSNWEVEVDPETLL